MNAGFGNFLHANGIYNLFLIKIEIHALSPRIFPRKFCINMMPHAFAFVLIKKKQRHKIYNRFYLLTITTNRRFLFYIKAYIPHKRD